MLICPSLLDENPVHQDESEGDYQQDVGEVENKLGEGFKIISAILCLTILELNKYQFIELVN